ncbi:MAG: YgjV family protein [Alphaproteobacteria bacterium]|nr:YgjV family protein [Alphaproteobacteria bacterium]
MHISIIIGNLFSLLSAICVAISVVKKNKKDFMHWQIGEALFGMIVNIILSAYTALVISIVCFIRNILSYKNKLTKNITLILLVISAVIGLYANNLGTIGLLPIIASSSYTLCIYITKNEQQMRYASVINTLLWFFHDKYIKAYPSAILCLILSIWTTIQIIKNIKKK